MAHDSIANPGSGGDTFVTVDLSLNTYPSGSGKVPATVLYASADTTHAPTVFTTGQKTMANSLGVVIASDQSGIPVTGTFWQATQPVSAASLPLPSGASTAAKQPALGTAGTASADVITIQGIASMTPILATASQSGTWNIGTVTTVTTVSAVTSITNPVTVVGDAASGAANAGNPVKVGGAFNTTQPTVTTGQAVDAQYTARGAAIVATGVDTFTVTVGAAIPAGANTIGAVTQASGPWSQNITQVAGAAIAQGHGTAATAIRVELPTDGTGVVGLNAGTAKIGTVTTDQTTHGTTDLVAADITKVAGSAIAQGHGTAASAIRVELPTDGTGTLATISTVTSLTQMNGVAITLNKGASDTGTQRVTLGDGTQTIGAIGINAGSNTIGGVTPVASTTGGATPYKYIIAAAANQDSANVKASAGTLYGVDAFLNVGSIRYLKLYDKATAPTSADTPKRVILIPANTSGAGVVKSFPVGLLFSSGIGHRITTGIADNDTGAATANDGVINLEYA